MFRNRMFLSAMIIVTVSALVIGGTAAWFYGVKNEGATVTFGQIGISATAGFPLQYGNILPGEQQSDDFDVVVGGNRPADLYFQLVGDGAGTNFCWPVNLGILVYVENLTNPGWPVYGENICNLYAGHPASKIFQLADDVAPGDPKGFRVYVNVPGSVPNGFQAATNTDYVRLIAVQYNGPAPMPDTDGGGPSAETGWPTDTWGGDDDPNY